jgi:hypothetical protein
MENNLLFCSPNRQPSIVCSDDCSNIDLGFHISDDKDILGELLIQLINSSIHNFLLFAKHRADILHVWNHWLH